MRAELTQIDLSPLDALVRIREEEAVLEDRLAKMEARNKDVSPVVYGRVKSDYETRRTELARESQPLKEKALREYQRLKALRAEVERTVQQISLEKEELEFRKELGEFVSDEFARRFAECEKRLADARRDLDDVLRMRATFAAAFRSEEELESGAPLPGAAPQAPAPQAPAPPSPVRPPAPAPPPAQVRPAPAPAPPAPVAPPAPAPPPPPAPRIASRAAEDVLTPDGTAITAARPLPSRTPTAPTAPAFASPDTAPQDTAPPHSATIVLPRARLSLLEGNEPVKEFPLRPGVSVIGRLAQSDIQLPSPDVSRRHAQVTVGPEGCFVADLGSENGVAVNGHLVENRRLEDGDIIVLGKQRLRFHT